MKYKISKIFSLGTHNLYQRIASYPAFFEDIIMTFIFRIISFKIIQWFVCWQQIDLASDERWNMFTPHCKSAVWKFTFLLRCTKQWDYKCIERDRGITRDVRISMVFKSLACNASACIIKLIVKIFFAMWQTSLMSGQATPACDVPKN